MKTQRIQIRGMSFIVQAPTQEELNDKVKTLLDRGRSDIPTTTEDNIDHERNRRHFEGYDW